MGDEVKLRDEEKRMVVLELSEDTVKLLQCLATADAMGGPDADGPQLERVLKHLAHSAADGVRRPGSWERAWLQQAFGDFSHAIENDGPFYSKPKVNR